MSVQRGRHTGKMFLLTLFSVKVKQSMVQLEYFINTVHLASERGAVLVLLKSSHTTSCSEFSRNQLPNSVSDLLAPPAAESREKSYMRGFCMYLTSIYFLEKRKKKNLW